MVATGTGVMASAAEMVISKNESSHNIGTTNNKYDDSNKSLKNFELS